MTLWIYTNVHQPRADQITFTNGYLLPECGTTEPINPTWTCLPSDQYSIDGFNADVRGLIFPLIVLAFLFAEQPKKFRDIQARDNNKEEKHVNLFVHVKQLLLLRHDKPTVWLEQGWHQLWSRIPNDAKHRLDDAQTNMRRFSRESTYKAEDWADAILKKCPAWLNKSGTVVRSNVITPIYTWTRSASIRLWTYMRNIEIHKALLLILDACYKIVPFLAEVGIVTINIVLLVQYAGYLKVIGDGSWSLGQVISVTIWVPVVVEYVYLLICGIEEGFECRLSEPYHVKKDDADSSDEDEGTTVDAATLRKDSSSEDDSDAVELDSLRDGEPVDVQHVLLVPKRPYTGT
ncbi:hypothetical protein LTR78_002297 [Recurvomyces mirabilis]|uniref:Uncharacterized protein n=1 Tax=Recurvomyces mirabilis TaxID=574656 RepID=A0AAE0WUL0_9PEZI|nr:hypothetical protein LTR78_002297 [Recurvomyces mirabilis]KAK5160752.1 hypothetical protein LTS14_001765 [Recurvomyces mirabilis]